MASAPLRRVRHALGNLVRASTPWNQKIVRPHDVANPFGARFGNNDWHHLRETYKEIDANPDITVQQTTLWRYLKDFRPRSICELLEAPGDPKDWLPLFLYPWGTFRRRELFTDKDPKTSRFCGPSSDMFIADEFARIKSLRQALSRSGYRPTAYPNSHIGGVWLAADGGQSCFVVTQGNHRMAALAHLGCEAIPVRAMRGHLRVVREDQLSSWPLVRQGRCSEEMARKVFRLFFEESGWHIADYLDKPDRRGV